MQKGKFNIPKEVTYVTEVLEKGGFEAYLIGGCVRDLIIGNKPKDWDITTNANPEEIQGLFEKTFYENDFGTVGVVNEEVSDETLKVIEVTPYRTESKYSDKRHPDSVIFSLKIEDDLERRDFSMNAIAYDISKGQMVDLHKGQNDIKDKIIKTVGNAQDRFSEDALRMLRAIRLASELDFEMGKEVQSAIKKQGKDLQKISQERIRDEFSKIIMSNQPKRGVEMMQKFGVLKYVVPEIEKGMKIEQNGDHIFDVWEHHLRALQHSAERKFPLHIRLAVLFHDISKPETRRWSKEKNDWTFYGHDVVGARVSQKIMERLRFPKETTLVVKKLVRNHMFFTDIDKITLSAVRRIVSSVGAENVWDLMKVRVCDRIGMGRPKETPYRLRKYESMIEEAMRAPVSVGMLKIDGNRIIEITKERPGPKIGFILHALLEEVLDDPILNTEKVLEKKALSMIKLPNEELKKLGEKGRDKKEKEEEKEVTQIRKKYWVK